MKRTTSKFGTTAATYSAPSAQEKPLLLQITQLPTLRDHARSDFHAHALKRRTATRHPRSTTTVSQPPAHTECTVMYHAARVGLPAQKHRPERAPAQRLYELQPVQRVAQVLRQRGAAVPAESSEAQRTSQQVERTTHSREHMIVDGGRRSGNNSVCIVTPPNPRRFHALYGTTHLAVVRRRSLAAWISFSVSIPSPELSSTLPVLRRPAAPPGRLSWLSDRVRRWSSCSAT
jgi:hypothetical protein